MVAGLGLFLNLVVNFQAPVPPPDGNSKMRVLSSLMTMAAVLRQHLG